MSRIDALSERQNRGVVRVKKVADVHAFGFGGLKQFPEPERQREGGTGGFEELASVHGGELGSSFFSNVPSNSCAGAKDEEST